MTTFPDSHSEFLDFPVASLTTIGDDGFPQSTLTWFLHDGGELKLSLNATRLKTKNLLKRPQVSLLIIDFSDPMRYLEVRGTAKTEPDPDKSFAQKVGAKYDADLAAWDGPGEDRIVVTVEPKNIYAVDMHH
ncbi:MAG TPA: PPOX class F420-dependent oxidoreductase [Solirubrobacteraceae bacterium]|jgi:PPOX class probable F420-dependent enzyme|nr:PPOX class F420-dependent oxidoreductase [Solirubrobacteraceae bacterium]